MAEVTVPMEETKLSDLMADEPVREAPEPVPTPEPEAQPEGDRARDDKGRFVAKEQEAQPQEVAPAVTEPTAPTEQDGQIPPWRLREMREERDAARQEAQRAAQEGLTLRQQMQALQQQLTQLQKPKPEPVDFFQNPDEALQQRLSPVEDRFNNLAAHLTYRASLAENIATHGREAVAEMRKAIKAAHDRGDPGVQLLERQMDGHGDPVGLAMDWYKQSSLVQRTGGDLDAYVQKQLDEKLKDPAFLAKAMEAARAKAGQAPPTPSIKLPPSLNKATGSGITGADLDDHDMSDAALFKHAAAPARRG